jgi:hypothetical protein
LQELQLFILNLVEDCIDAFWAMEVSFETLQSRRRMNKVVATVACFLAEHGHEAAAELVISECQPLDADS